jgi:CTP synthase
VAVQFHPEFQSKPLAPHPLFADFIRASVENRKVRLGQAAPASVEVGR